MFDRDNIPFPGTLREFQKLFPDDSVVALTGWTASVTGSAPVIFTPSSKNSRFISIAPSVRLTRSAPSGIAVGLRTST